MREGEQPPPLSYALVIPFTKSALNAMTTMLAFAIPTADVPMFMMYCALLSNASTRFVPGGEAGMVALPLRGTTPEPAGKHTAGEAPPAKAAEVGYWNAVNPVVFTSIVIEETVAELVTLKTLAAPDGLLENGPLPELAVKLLS